MISASKVLEYRDLSPVEKIMHRVEQAEARQGGGVSVYFIGGDDTPIKIGISADPAERLRKLQTAHWAKLRVLAVMPGGFAEERAYHARFAEHRMNGEWFDRHPDILAEIARLTQGDPA